MARLQGLVMLSIFARAVVCLLSSETNTLHELHQLGWIDQTSCNASGIICRADHVFQLHLPSKGLKGSLEPFKGLPYLQILNLNNNSLSGTLAPIENLTRLISLDLGRNQISGPLTTMEKLVQIAQLKLPDNRLTGTMDALRKMSSLMDLDLAWNQLKGSFEALKDKVTLMYVNLDDNQLLTGSFELLRSNFLLKELTLNGCKIGGTIPDWLHLSWPNLAILKLDRTQISGPLPQSVTKLKLTSFSARSNTINGTLPRIWGLTSLESLDLTNNRIIGTLPADMGHSINLRVLKLGTNMINGTIPASFANMKLLQELSIEYNKFNGPIPEWILGLANLRVLRIKRNFFGGPIPEKIGQLTALRILDMSKNFLDGAFPEGLAKLTMLEILNLSWNLIGGTLPERLEKLTMLKELDFSHNQIGGPIGEWIGELSLLETLSANDNQLEGSFPVHLGNVTSLQTLKLAGNLFDGQIPWSFARLTNLDTLDLSNNIDVSGPIPEIFQNLTKLQTLNLSRCQLSGGLPATMSAATMCSWIDLSVNQLHTENLEVNLPHLPRLYLNDNAFSGMLAKVNMHDPSVIDVTGNDFWCPYPDFDSHVISLKDSCRSFDDFWLVSIAVVAVVLVFLAVAIRSKIKTRAAGRSTDAAKISQEEGVTQQEEGGPTKSIKLFKVAQFFVLWILVIVDVLFDINFSVDMLMYVESIEQIPCDFLNDRSMFTVRRFQVILNGVVVDSFPDPATKPGDPEYFADFSGFMDVVNNFPLYRRPLLEKSFTEFCMTMGKTRKDVCVFLEESNKCVQNPDWTNPYEGFGIAVYVMLVLLVCKELSKLVCILWLLAARQGKVPRGLRRFCGTSVFAPLLACRGWTSFAQDIVMNVETRLDSAYELFYEGVLENIPQLVLSQIYTWNIVEKGLDAFQLMSVCVTTICCLRMLFKAIRAVYDFIKSDVPAQLAKRASGMAARASHVILKRPSVILQGAASQQQHASMVKVDPKIADQS